MKRDIKKISVIMPVYNAERYISEAIESVLGQTEGGFELIIIDDSSKDGSFEIILGYAKQDKRIKVYRNDENYGIAYTRNKGIRLSCGEAIAFMDNDDIAPADRLRISKEYLNSHPIIGAVGGNYTIFNNKEEFVVQDMRFLTEEDVRAELLFHNIIPNCSMMLRREIIEDYGIWFQEFYGIEDYDFWSRVAIYSSINVLPLVMLRHRVFENQYSAVCTSDKILNMERQKAFDLIHKGMLLNLGVNLTEAEYGILLPLIREKRNQLSSFKEWGNLMRLSKKIITSLMGRGDFVNTNLVKRHLRKLVYDSFKDNVIVRR